MLSVVFHWRVREFLVLAENVNPLISGRTVSSMILNVILRATKLAFIGVDDHSMSIEVSVSNLYVIIDFGNQYSHSLLLMGGALIYYSSYQYYN